MKLFSPEQAYKRSQLVVEWEPAVVIFVICGMFVLHIFLSGMIWMLFLFIYSMLGGMIVKLRLSDETSINLLFTCIYKKKKKR